MPKRTTAFLTLFSSVITLVCCALPALLVSLGLGASLASLVGSFPQLIWLSEHKGLVFGFAGVMLAIAWWGRRYGDIQACPADPDLARACSVAKGVSGYIFYGSLSIYLVGFFFAFIAPYFMSV